MVSVSDIFNPLGVNKDIDTDCYRDETSDRLFTRQPHYLEPLLTTQKKKNVRTGLEVACNPAALAVRLPTGVMMLLN